MIIILLLVKQFGLQTSWFKQRWTLLDRCCSPLGQIEAKLFQAKSLQQQAVSQNS
jgi:hypothetical protein